MTAPRRQTLWRAVAVAVWAALAWSWLRHPWFCDEALQLLRSALNLCHLGTSAFNPGAAGSVPGQALWVWLLGAAAAAHFPLTVAAVGLEVSAVVIGVAALGYLGSWTGSTGPHRCLQQAVVACLLATVACLRGFLLSGLETALVFGLLCVLGAAMAGAPRFGKTVRLGLVLGLSSLVVLADPSLSLPIVVLGLAWAWGEREWVLSRWRTAVVVLALPVIFLLLRRVAGVPFIPKSAWETLIWQLPEPVIARHGFAYVADVAAREPIVLFLIGLALLVGLWGRFRRSPQRLPLVFAVAAGVSVMWIILTGGSDVSGRLWIGPVTLAALALVSIEGLPLVPILVVAGFVAAFFDWNKLSPTGDRQPAFPHTVALFRQWGIHDVLSDGSGLSYDAAIPVVSAAQARWALLDQVPPLTPLVKAAPGVDGLKLGPRFAVLDERLAAVPSLVPRSAGAISRTWSTVESPELAGALTIRLKIARQPEGAVEPILAATSPNHAVRVTLTHLAADAVRFGLTIDHHRYEVPLVRGVDPSAEHRLSVWYGQAVIGDPRMGIAALAFDGVRLREVFCRLDHYAVGDVVVGWNGDASLREGRRFAGEIMGVTAAVSSDAWPWSPPDGSDAVVTFRLSPSSRASQPIVSWGEGDQSDVVFVRRLGPGSIVFGLEHHGDAPIYGPALPVNDSRDLVATLTLPPLFVTEPGIAAKDRLVVSLDGRVALVARKAFYPAAPHGLHFFDNPTVSSFVGGQFLDEIVGVRAVESPLSQAAVGRVLAAGHGPLHLQLSFQDATIGSAMGLMETGHAGAGDIVYVTRLDRSHLQFGFDHWGRGGLLGKSVAINPDREHDVRILTDTVFDSDARKTGRVLVTVDGQPALVGDMPCYPATLQLVALLQDTLGSSCVRIPFDGLCAGLSREP